MWEQILKGSFLCLKSWVTQVALKGREQADKVWELRKTSPDWFKGMFRDLLRTPGKSWMSWGGWKIVPILWGLGSRKSSRVTSHTIETPTFLLLCKVQDPQLLPIRISKPSFRNISLHGPRGWLFKARSVAPCKEENTPFHHLGPMVPSLFPLFTMLFLFWVLSSSSLIHWDFLEGPLVSGVCVIPVNFSQWHSDL